MAEKVFTKQKKVEMAEEQICLRMEVATVFPNTQKFENAENANWVFLKPMPRKLKNMNLAKHVGNYVLVEQNQIEDYVLVDDDVPTKNNVPTKMDDYDPAKEIEHVPAMMEYHAPSMEDVPMEYMCPQWKILLACRRRELNDFNKNRICLHKMLLKWSLFAKWNICDHVRIQVDIARKEDDVPRKEEDVLWKKMKVGMAVVYVDRKEEDAPTKTIPSSEDYSEDDDDDDDDDEDGAPANQADAKDDFRMKWADTKYEEINPTAKDMEAERFAQKNKHGVLLTPRTVDARRAIYTNYQHNIYAPNARAYRPW
jgi:hypothetical protein